MKFLNGKNKTLFLIAISLVFAGCKVFWVKHYSPFGTWQYESVKKGKKPLFSISSGDTLNVWASDSSFNYVIQKAGKTAHGHFSMIHPHRDSGAHWALVFTYEPGGKQRIFNITHLSQSKMTLREGNLYFRFRRIR